MGTSYDEAVARLYRAPHQDFVAERKRLAAELKAAGDADGAARLAKLARPPLSAWAVNQLWWTARPEFTALFESASELRRGQLSATSAHREAERALRARAAALLTAAGHAATEATLRRIMTTLSALAVAGGFEPDPPGGLSADRDPPGFGGMTLDALPAAPAKREPAPKQPAPKQPAIDAAERRRLEAEQAKKQAERQRLQAALRTAERAVEGLTARIDEQSRELERLQAELAEARAELETARSTRALIATQLEKLG